MGDTPRPSIVLLGPFRTGPELARMFGDTGLMDDERVLRIASSIGIAAAFPAFQFDDHGLRPDCAAVNLLLRRRVDDLTACAWYTTSHQGLGNATPLAHLNTGGDLEDLLDLLPEPVRARPGNPPVPPASQTSVRPARSIAPHGVVTAQ